MSTSPTIWSSIKRLLVVTDFKDVDNMHQWRDAIKFSGLNIHDCTIMGIVPSKKERLNLGDIGSVVFISEKDYGFFGGLKNEDAHKIFGEAYDAVLIIRSIPKKIDKSLSKMKVKLDIALNAENATRTINLHTDESAPKYMLNFVKQTLEKIT